MATQPSVQPCFTSWHNGSEPLVSKWLHPCEIDGVRHLVHHPDLAVRAPEYFDALKGFAQENHWQLKEDQRHKRVDTSAPEPTKRRRKLWLPIVLLAFTVGASVSRENEVETRASAVMESESMEYLRLYALPPKTASTKKDVDTANAQNSMEEHYSLDSYNAFWHKKILNVLRLHHRKNGKTPYPLKSELDNIAAYFSQFPKVRSLIEDIRSGPWQLQYSEKTFETRVVGNRFEVESITVHYDPRSAAQFKFYRACTDKIPYCVASPADVLLHELIHLKAILTNPQQFIAEGGMGSMMYPFEHERRTIDEERVLYSSMTRIDGKPRPLRSEHVGQHVLAACATCLQ